MFTFKEYIIEQVDGAKNRADSMGKLHELLVGKHLNNGSFSEHHRTEEGTPEQVHHKHATALYGEDYKNHPQYKQAENNALKAANGIKEHLKKHGIHKIGRVAWTSQPSDHHKETGVHDPNSTADIIVTSHDKKKQVGVSLKVGETKTPNYKNPGMDTYENWSGRSLKNKLNDHVATLAKHGNPTHETYKSWRDHSDAKMRAKAADIKSSSDKTNRAVAAEIHSGLSEKSHDELQNIIRHSTTPKTHLPTIVSHTVLNKQGAAESHDVHDQEHHVENYLSKFKDLHMKPHNNKTSVTIMGTHKETGKKMPVWSTTVYAGGKPANKSPRGATTLPSEAKV